jgi:arabinogalactan oligomer / maltooligosaccharide transport system permease protein
VSLGARFGGRAALGLALGLSLALFGLASVGGRAAKGVQAQQSERQAIIAARAVADLAAAAGGTGDAARTIAARFTGGDSPLTAVRVLAFDGLSLEASTFAADQGEKAAPRRLAREEKDFFDQGQRLRAAVETNRAEGVARKEEIEVLAAPGGGMLLAVPVEIDGAVTGAVLAQAKPSTRLLEPPIQGALLAAALALLAFVVASISLRDRPKLAAGLAGGLLLAVLAWVGHTGWEHLAEGRRLGEQQLATTVAKIGGLAADTATSLGLPASALDPSTLDCDRFRRPRGLLDGQGNLVTAALEKDLQAGRSRAQRWVGLISLLGLGAVLFVGLGYLARLGRTLVLNKEAYLYTMPAILGMIFLVYFPFSYGIALSFTDSTLYNNDKPLFEKWNGLENYREILGDFSVVKQSEEGSTYNYENFYWTLGFTILWTVTNVVWGVTVGLLLALVLNSRGLKLRPIYRVLLILPWAVPNYITALVWKGMFHQQLGVVNQVLQMFGGSPVSWFEKPFTSYLAILATNGWLSFPFMMVISLGALQSIPGELYEAAKVDGATRWQQFKAITLPSLKPALIPSIILSVIWTFNMFNIPYLTSGGEPAHSTEILITGAYKIAFEKYQYGYAAAYASIIFLILLAYGSWQNKVTKATEGIA